MVKKFKLIVCFIVLAATIFAVSMAVVWLGDDIDYCYFITDSIWNSFGHLNSITRFFASQANHYWYVNGRFVAHTLVQLFCGVAGKAAFAAANALVYCTFIYLILKICGVRSLVNNVRAVVTCIAIVMLTFITKMMPTTQIGFVWMFTLNLLWLRLFLNHRHASVQQIAGICLLGALAGNGQEALTLGLSASLGLWWLHHRCRIGKARTAMLVCYWAGTLAICLSPGTLGRAETMDVTFSQSMLYLAMSLRATYMLIITLLILRLRKRITLRQVYRQNALFINAMLVMFAFNIIIGVYCNRQLFGIELMALLVMLRILPRHSFASVCNIALVFAVAYIVWLQYRCIQQVKHEYTEIEQFYSESDNGIVYYDRTIASNNIFMREYRYYEEIVGQFNGDAHHSLQKLLRYKYPHKKALHVWPTYIHGRTAVSDTIIEYAPQHYFVIKRDATPSTIQMCTHFTLRGGASDSHDTASDSHATVTDLPIIKYTVHGVGWQSMIVVPHTPFHAIDYVIFRP